jgi:hypothetical protein
VIAIASINAFNRINIATEQITGEGIAQWISGGQAAEQAA